MVPPGIAEVAARAQRELAGRVLAITLRSVRDLDIAEEATADAFLLALQTWPERGVPASVEAWLVTAARRRAIDRIRSAQAARRALVRTAGGLRSGADAADLSIEVGVIGDEDLRLVVLRPADLRHGPDCVDLAARLRGANRRDRRRVPDPGDVDGRATDPGEEEARRGGAGPRPAR
jgi:hypothetical protein